MITQGEFIMIHELKKQGYSIHAIARITGKDRKTIRHHLRKTELEVISRTNKKPSKLDGFKVYILDRISKASARIPSKSVTAQCIIGCFINEHRA
jgi:transposase